MPAKSKAQFKMMAAIASGSMKHPTISKAQAAEFVHATKNPKALPTKKPKPKR